MDLLALPCLFLFNFEIFLVRVATTVHGAVSGRFDAEALDVLGTLRNQLGSFVGASLDVEETQHRLHPVDLVLSNLICELLE